MQTLNSVYGTNSASISTSREAKGNSSCSRGRSRQRYCSTFFANLTLGRSTYLSTTPLTMKISGVSVMNSKRHKTALFSVIFVIKSCRGVLSAAIIEAWIKYSENESFPSHWQNLVSKTNRIHESWLIERTVNVPDQYQYHRVLSCIRKA